MLVCEPLSPAPLICTLPLPVTFSVSFGARYAAARLMLSAIANAHGVAVVPAHGPVSQPVNRLASGETPYAGRGLSVPHTRPAPAVPPPPPRAPFLSAGEPTRQRRDADRRPAFEA